MAPGIYLCHGGCSPHIHTIRATPRSAILATGKENVSCRQVAMDNGRRSLVEVG